MLNYIEPPSWLKKIERHFSWIAIPNIAIILVTLQVLGFFMVGSNPYWIEYLALFPQNVMEGEFWRIITFLSLPISMSPIWVIFVLWFLYFIISAIEEHWGPFYTTLYIVISVFITVIYSLSFDYPVTQASHFESTLFLAAATLMPEYEVRLFLILPVKMKWLGILTGVFVIIQFFLGSNLDKGYLIGMYLNYAIFFGHSFFYRIKIFIENGIIKEK